jgi:two-component system, LytTR family, sensor kinase
MKAERFPLLRTWFAACPMLFARNPMPRTAESSIMNEVGPLHSSEGGGTGTREGTPYPGVGRMFLIWTAIGVLTVLRSQSFRAASEAGHGAFAVLLACTSWYFPWALLTPLVFRLEQRFPVGAPGWPRRVALLAAISAPFCLAASPVMIGLDAAIRYASGAPAWVSGSVGFWFAPFPTAEGLFWCSVAGGYFFRTLFQLQEQEKRAARLALEKSRLEASLNQAQLDALRAKLNPHFLFNSLQNISVLMKQDPDTASRMLAVLGDLLRAVLRRDSQPETTLGEEIDLTRSYAALEQMRFADRLCVTFEIPDEVKQAMVPCFLMQPLLENAIKHGLRGVRKTGIIAVRVAQEENRLAITVTDNGVGTPADMNGIKIGVGLGSTCERLARMYPERHQLSIQRPPEGGTEVRIVIPIRFASSVDEGSPHEEIPAPNR